MIWRIGDWASVVAFVLLPVWPPLAPEVARSETVRLQRTIALGARAVRVETTVGDVSITGWDRPEIEIAIRRTVPVRADLDKVTAVVEEETAAIAVRAVQADGATLPALRGDIAIRAPAGCSFESIRMLEGTLTLADLRGRVTAVLQRGLIQASNLTGTIRLETGIGSLSLDRARLAPDGLLRLRTFNGDVKLDLAERPADARVLALTFNGTITSAIPLAMKDRFGPRFGESTIGRGAPLVSIDVVTGDITITVR